MHFLSSFHLNNPVKWIINNTIKRILLRKCNKWGTIFLHASKIPRPFSLSNIYYISNIFWPGKTRYGVCVNFYRAVEKAPAPGPRERIVLRRESWRKSMEKSSDSAFSRWTFSIVIFFHNTSDVLGLFYALLSTAF